MYFLFIIFSRSNQLTVLPREICLLPLQVLLVSNNRLTSLPEELGRMDQLTELDAACNQVTHLPPRISDLKKLKSLSLRNNQLVYLPRGLFCFFFQIQINYNLFFNLILFTEVTCLNLVTLDISGNRIATLPVELRNMTSLVNLELENNPLTTPPASVSISFIIKVDDILTLLIYFVLQLCVRGLVHVFKYLDTHAAKEERIKSGGAINVDGHTTLRRTLPKQNASLLDYKSRRQHVDSGYSTCDGLEKRWSQEMPPNPPLPLPQDNGGAKWSPQPIHVRTENFSQSGNSTPSLSPAGQNILCGNSEYNDDQKRVDEAHSNELHQKKMYNNGSNHSNRYNNTYSKCYFFRPIY